jgi:hypothetical protein
MGAAPRSLFRISRQESATLAVCGIVGQFGSTGQQLGKGDPFDALSLSEFPHQPLRIPWRHYRYLKDKQCIAEDNGGIGKRAATVADDAIDEFDWHKAAILRISLKLIRKTLKRDLAVFKSKATRDYAGLFTRFISCLLADFHGCRQ